MRGVLAWSSTEVRAGLLSLVAAALLVLAIIVYRRWQASRIPPQERERLRRALLVSRGKMGDAMLVEIRGDFIFFTYSVRGIEYTASQDVSALKDYMPPDLSVLSALAVKYLPQNPANSIVIAEQWTGFRQLKRS